MFLLCLNELPFDVNNKFNLINLSMRGRAFILLTYLLFLQWYVEMYKVSFTVEFSRVQRFYIYEENIFYASPPHPRFSTILSIILT